jgi:hypothetical protein
MLLGTTGGGSVKKIKLAAAGFLWMAVAAFGQAGLGSISGTVVDTADAVVPNAKIKVIQVSTNSERLTQTNELGIFNIPSLLASEYNITISAPGFKDKTLSNVTLNAFRR